MVGGDDASTPSRLKQWAVGVGKKERERVRALEAVSQMAQVYPRADLNEIARERGVRLISEGRGKKSVACLELVLQVVFTDPPGTYIPVHLASVTRAPTLQHMSERVALISAQHNLAPPTKTVASLMMVACEVRP